MSVPFKILQYNIHHGNDTLNKSALDEQVGVMAAQNADLITLTECEQFTGYGNMDMAAAIQAKLASAGLTYNLAHKNDLSGGDNAGQHLVALSKTPITNVQTKGIAYGFAMFLFDLTINGHPLHFVTAHLQHIQSTPGEVDKLHEGMRCTQQVDMNYNITNLLPPSTVRFILGDLNTLPDGPSLDPLRLWYYDCWGEVGTPTTFAPNGETYMPEIPPFDATDYPRRIDYVFYGKKTWNTAFITLNSADVIDTRRPDGSRPSDHNPLVVGFTIA